MQYGLTEDIIRQMINIFANMHKVEEVIIYGSRAMGNYQQGSDIDLALRGKDLNMDDLLKIGVKLDDLDLPYHLDLLILDKIENYDLSEHISKVGKTIYNRYN
jgi:predicted nucleotidyltransferase